MEQKVINVVIVGGEEESAGLLRSLASLKGVHLAGLVCGDNACPGCATAQELKVERAASLKDLSGLTPVDLAIETSGRSETVQALRELLPEGTQVIDRSNGSLLFLLAWQCERLLKVESAYKLASAYSQMMEVSNKKLDEKMLESELLGEASRLFSASLDPRNVSAQVYDLVVRKVAVDASVLVLFKEEGTEEMIVTSRASASEDFILRLKEQVADLAFTEMGRRLRQGHVPVITCRGEQFDPAVPALSGPCESSCFVPLNVGGNCFGYFGLVARRPQAFSPEETKFFNTVATQMAVFIESDSAKDRILAVNTALREQGDELARVNERLERINRELDDFTYTVSHDLKEPLRVVESFAKFLKEDYPRKLGPKGCESIEAITQASRRMRLLIDSLLELSRIAREERVLSPVDLNELLARVADSFKVQLKEKHVILKLAKGLPVIRCQGLRVGQLFSNLISNAIKFMDKPNTVIEVGCQASEAKDEYTFTVKDNGRGIHPGDHERIFQIFQRGQGAEQAEGTGAGLTIAKKIVEEHQGRIWLESKVGVGSTFYFTLPKV